MWWWCKCGSILGDEIRSDESHEILMKMCSLGLALHLLWTLFGMAFQLLLSLLCHKCLPDPDLFFPFTSSDLFLSPPSFSQILSIHYSQLSSLMADLYPPSYASRSSSSSYSRDHPLYPPMNSASSNTSSDDHPPSPPKSPKPDPKPQATFLTKLYAYISIFFL